VSFRRGQRVRPLHIDPEDASYLRVAADLIGMVDAHLGQRRADLERALEDYVGVGTDYKVLRGLIKLLLDRCEFEVSAPADPVDIRRAVFSRARARHPVTAGADRDEVFAEAAAALGSTPAAIAEALYADLPENQRLIMFEPLTSEELLDAYNLAQAQALLYRSVQMRIWVEPQDPAGYRQLFDAIKAYRLIHTITGSPATGYEVRLDGPVSMFHRSQKYGVQMAVFLPALLACSGWRMQAEIESKGRGSAMFELESGRSALAAGPPGAGPDKSALVDKFVASWAQLGTGWEAAPSREVLDLDGIAFIPDASLHGPAGEAVYVEFVGFWTPRYIADRLREFERASFRDFILAVSEELRASREPAESLPPNVVVYKTSLDARSVKAAVDRLTA
jgi:predicted nuclease of restriction endonuclease-like RecB superfamily